MSVTSTNHQRPNPPRRLARAGLCLGAVALVGTACGGSSEDSIEELIEQNSGEDVDIDFGEDGFSVQTEDGEFSIEVDEDGSFTFDSDDGSGSFDADGEGGGDFTFDGDGESGDISVDTDEDGNIVITDDSGSSSGDTGDTGGVDLDDLLDDLDLGELLGEAGAGGLDLGALLDDLDLGDLDTGDVDLGDIFGDINPDGDGSFTVEGPDGETGEFGDDGFTISGEDGDTTFQSGAGLPDQWPDDVPQPPGLDDPLGTYIADGGSVNLSVIGSVDGDAEDYLDAYRSVLEGAGFTETFTYGSPETGGGFTAERDETTTITVNVSTVVPGSPQVVVALQLEG